MLLPNICAFCENYGTRIERIVLIFILFYIRSIRKIRVQILLVAALLRYALRFMYY